MVITQHKTKGIFEGDKIFKEMRENVGYYETKTQTKMNKCI